jgi:predicted DNA-binding ribbon-helix-helix protein
MAKRSVVISGHKTSISLEDAFWSAFLEIARDRKLTASEIATIIDSERVHTNLSSAIRLFVLDHFRSRTCTVADDLPLQQGRCDAP